jgi:ribosomal protein S18 acetylase RimI-like enzyme
MLTFEAAQTEQYEEFMRLMLDEARDYLEETQKLMQMSTEEFNHLFRTVGHVYAIYDDERCAGFYWIEERERVLHLHALILKSQFQGRGIGTKVLKMLSSEYDSRMKFIELGVHESNERAIRMYERNGFSTVKRLDDLKFRIMQKPMSAQH